MSRLGAWILNAIQSSSRDYDDRAAAPPSAGLGKVQAPNPPTRASRRPLAEPEERSRRRRPIPGISDPFDGCPVDAKGIPVPYLMAGGDGQFNRGRNMVTAPFGRLDANTVAFRSTGVKYDYNEPRVRSKFLARAAERDPQLALYDDLWRRDQQ